MNKQEIQEAVNAYARSLRGKYARSCVKPKSAEEMKQTMRQVRACMTPESWEKARLARIGLKRSDESKAKMRQAALGRKHSEETKEKIRQGRAKQIVTDKMKESLKLGRGENSILWKGDDVGYRALHRWVEGKLGKPETCETCLTPQLKGHDIHWANKSGEYKREEADWIRLCALCHKKYDRNIIS